MIFHIDISASSIPQTILSSVQNAMRAYTWALVDQAICSITLARHDAMNYKKTEETGQIPSTSFINAFVFLKKDLVCPTSDPPALRRNISSLSPLISHTIMPQRSPQ